MDSQRDLSEANEQLDSLRHKFREKMEKFVDPEARVCIVWTPLFLTQGGGGVNVPPGGEFIDSPVRESHHILGIRDGSTGETPQLDNIRCSRSVPGLGPAILALTGPAPS